jgi:hypothetical protein
VRSVDTRCHFLSPHSAQLEAAAEGLDLVNLLATLQDYPSQDGHMYRVTPNITAFSGQQSAIDRVFVNTFNVHPALGRLGLLNCHRTVYPLTFGYIDETDDWSLSDWCDQCHRKKGLVIWCDAYRNEAGLPGGEALVGAILGKVDAIEIDAHGRSAPFLTHWYRLLNAGIQLPIVGGSGKDSNRIAIGGMRTFTPTVVSSSYADWVACVQAGKTVAGTGPVIQLDVNGQFPGDQFIADAAQPLRIRASVSSRDAVECLDIVANGEVIGSASFKANEKTQLEIEHYLVSSGWVTARCWSWGSSKPGHPCPQGPISAHTSPVWVNVPGKPFLPKPSAIAVLQREIEGVRHWVETTGRFTNPKRKEHLLSLCAAASAKLAGQP